MAAEPINNLSRNKVAMLIDGDNAQAALLPQMLVEAGRHGQVTVRRIYGDWTTNSMNSWKEILNFHAFQPIQQFRYTIGKNATDSAMIIDAMDLLYAGHFAGFCLVSSDSDFTRLAARIRESGRRVYGFGEEKTPRPFVSACDRFIYTEVFAKKTEDEPGASPVAKRSTKSLRGDTRLLALIRDGIQTASDETGWAQLGAVGNYLSRTANDFDPRNYGYAKLSELIAAIGLFDVERRENRIFIKDTRKKSNGVP